MSINQESAVVVVPVADRLEGIDKKLEEIIKLEQIQIIQSKAIAKISDDQNEIYRRLREVESKVRSSGIFLTDMKGMGLAVMITVISAGISSAIALSATRVMGS